MLVTLDQNAIELAQPVAQVAMPAGFVWKVPHVMSVAVKGNAMVAVSMDDAAVIDILDLDAAAGRSTGLKIAGPQAGKYGLLAAWQAQVTVQQMTVAQAAPEQQSTLATDKRQAPVALV
jgi:hypothetical protein